jgi:hypothetical protein
MGKGQSPTSSELKFIYELLAEGYSDADILKKYDELERHGKLGSLPYRQDIRFIRQRRKEYEVAREMLKVTSRIELDPILVQAKQKHQEDMLRIVKEWIDAIKTPAIDDMTKYANKTTSDIEESPLFNCLRQHIQDLDLWNLHSLWTSKLRDYLLICSQLAEQIAEEEEFHEEALSLYVGIEHPILKRIAIRASGDPLGPHKYRSQFQESLPTNPSEVYSELVPIHILYVDDIPAIESSDIGHSKAIYQRISERYLNSTMASKIIAIYAELLSLESQIKQSLQNIYYKHFIPGSCIACPM